ncbi:Sensor histidine kinase LiaS [Lacunisphaera limnophila]|uniref:Sensor histidine kinase LiaS n=1 Tax=Lacunisphaera limnophila TaxID=1838286 RepID=A0A1D8ASR0_9BACT|nr:Sensor histidine kinase LiaS [Lacunisphaera limnophila]
MPGGPTERTPACRRLSRIVRTWCWGGLLAASSLTRLHAQAEAGGELGLPFTRFYSFEEIGHASRGMRLGFDPLGRIAMTRGGSCIVLNDTDWIDIANRTGNGTVMQRLVFAPDGEAYFGAFGLWGVARMNGGRLEPLALVPPTAPKWTRITNFNEVVAAPGKVWFAGLNGVVHWDRTTGRHAYFEIPGISRVFLLGDRLYFSSYAAGIGALDPAQETVEKIRTPLAEGVEIDQATAFDETRVLTTDIDGRLRFFDGRDFTPFPGPLGERPLGRATALTRLPDGNVALAINGLGLYLVSPTGQILIALTTPDYHRVTDLAARENGVLWAVNETGIEKILYKSPLTVFGQRQGLPLSWPQLVRWNGRIVVASGGRLYETIAGPPGETTRFRLMAEQPAASGVWGLAAAGPELLIGTNQGVQRRGPDGGFTPVIAGMDVARLVHVNGTVYVLGTTEIAALRQVDGRWTECAPRVRGVGYPMIVHGTNHAAWIELGPNRAARVHHRDGTLQVRVFEEFPWSSARWINIGWAGSTVALSGLPDGRLFFDEETESLIPAPPLGRILDQAPFPVTRFRQDADGTLWGTHDEGLLTIRLAGDQPVFDAETFGKVPDRFPLAQLLADGDIWLVTGQSLYHVNQTFPARPKPAFQPTLVSLTNGRTDRELLSQPGRPTGLPVLPYQDNSLVLRFFSGSYASRQPPAYTFRLYHGNDSRIVLGNRSLLTLTNLREGQYRLEATLTGTRVPAGPPLAFAFEIAPPWYRTAYAYALYAAALAGLIAGLMWWSAHRSRSRNVVLEKLVADRTNELRAAMQQLNEETRNTATLAERDRLAGEIHDSLQQGLSGLMLQLDATLKLADLTDDVRSRLLVARNMVSFTRHEVQHAVWDMETPLLEGTELGDALKKITGLIGPGAVNVQIRVTGAVQALPSATKHHLLRIAQEAITNAVRHAAAHAITILLAYEPAGVRLEVTDDGNGFVPSEVLTKGLGHFGLRGLRGRAGKIGGELQIQSAPGQGTTVRVWVPSLQPVV